MSNSMLEQAIVDAQALREAAMKNAESEIVEKYSDEVKQAVSRILEQDEDMDMDLGLGLDDEEAEIDSTAMEQVPMAHVSDSEEDIVEVDLDDIIAAAEDDEDEEFEMGRDEIADEIGIDLDTEAPANREDDEVNLDESELVELFKELLVLDVSETAIEDSMEESSADELEEDEEAVVQDDDVAPEPVEGMDKDDIEDYRKEKKANESLLIICEPCSTRHLPE
jgi:hypothetical protein